MGCGRLALSAHGSYPPPRALRVPAPPAMTGTAFGRQGGGAPEALLRSCLIFESKRMPRRRYTGFDVLPARNQFRSTIAMDMYNRMPDAGSWRIVAYVRAVL